MNVSLRLRRDATVTADGPAVRVAAPVGSATLPGLTDGLRAVVEALAEGDVTEVGLATLVMASDGDAGLLGLHMLLRRLDAGGWLEHAVAVGGQPLVRLRPVGVGARPRAGIFA